MRNQEDKSVPERYHAEQAKHGQDQIVNLLPDHVRRGENRRRGKNPKECCEVQKARALFPMEGLSLCVRAWQMQ